LSEVWGEEAVVSPRIVGMAVDCIEELMGWDRVSYKMTVRRQRRLRSTVRRMRKASR
jgi:hypothetical protein